MDTPQAAYLQVGAFVDELARAGLRHAVFCPGSRSTPLAMMLARESRIKLWMHLDERSAAFFALGMAKASRQAVAILCTSGTAAANFLPAVVEAHYAQVPLLVLTADRPPELRDTGAAQTMDQLKLYGDHAKWFVEVALPEGTTQALRYARTLACRAVAMANAAPAGAVHLNFPFREPLVPAPVKIDYPADDADAYQGRAEGLPYLRATLPHVTPQADIVHDLAARLVRTDRGLIVAGPQTDPELGPIALALGEALDFPVLADPLSQARCTALTQAEPMDAYDAFLRDPDVAAKLTPELVLRIGAIPTSKPLVQFLHRNACSTQILIGDGWHDPDRLAGEKLEGDLVAVCGALLSSVRRQGRRQAEAAGGWLALWRGVQRRSRQAITAALSQSEEFSESRVISELSSLVTDTATVWASSSMPVRDLDTFWPARPGGLRFYANRGVNGIDGVISSALGAGAVSGGPLVLVIGDIAFYHDMNGLLAAKLHALNATVILVHNDGGGIFSFLPQAADPEHFEQLFGTPHGLDFEPVARLYAAQYSRPANWAAFRAAVLAGLAGPGLHVVEVRTSRQRNVEQHRAIWPKVAAAAANETG